MNIKREISDKILTISTSRKENKGGIATVVNSLSNHYETFNYIASTRSKNPFIMLYYFGACVFGLIYYILIKRIRIVHIHGASYGSFVRKMILINICVFFNIKTIYHIHGGNFHLFYRKFNKYGIIKRTINKVDVLITLSNNGKDYFSSITNERKIFILGNMVANANFSRNYSECRSKLNFLFLGRIADHKGIFDLLDVIRDNKNHLKDKFILYVGGDGETEKLVKLIEKYEIQHLVKFEGWVSGEQRRDLLITCDVHILPSYNETFGMSNLEAMSYGMPIISTTVGGIPEVVSNNKNGFLIEPGDKKKMMEFITYFIEYPEEIERMGRKSMENAKRFYPENVIPQLNSIYEQLLCTSNKKKVEHV
jgi:glycosyltransferase involved in cell wall biosynthesis